MPEVHIPNLDEAEPPRTAEPASVPPAPRPHRRSFAAIALEVLLIALGVSLGLMGEQWRDTRHHRAMARETLERFRTEITTNRDAVAAVKDYHANLRLQLHAYLNADDKARRTINVDMKGLRPVNFDHSAWDLALAMESLADIDGPLAIKLSQVYGAQTNYAQLTTGILQAMYLRPPTEDLAAFYRSADLYYDDLVSIEPRLIALYDAILPDLDRVLGPRKP